MSTINRSKVKQLALHYAAQRFGSIPGYNYTRVSGEFLDRVEGMTRAVVASLIKQMPARRGKTIK
jgi:hypothetical protein